MSVPFTLPDWTCCVCDKPITDDPHTYHAEDCPARTDPDAECSGELDDNGICGDDCHAGCCPTCTGEG